MASNTRKQLESWLKTISFENKTVLDIGGSQNPIRARLGGSHNSEFVILDLEQPHEVVKSPDIIADLNTMSTMLWKQVPVASKEANIATKKLNNTFDEKFDIAFCLEVTEYLWNPYQALLNINHFLKKGGELYISFHFIYPHHNPVELDCMRYTKWGAEKLLKESGFEIETIVPRVVQDEGLLNAFFSSEGMRPSREFKGHNEIGYLIKARKI